MTQRLTTQPLTLRDIQLRHEELVYQNAENGNLDIHRIRTLLNAIAQAGTVTEKAEERYLLRDLIRYWSNVGYEKTGEYSSVELRPYDSATTRNTVVQHSIPSLFHRKISEPTSFRNGVNRQRMLKRVRSLWIDGALEQFLHYAPSITLRMSTSISSVENSIRLLGWNAEALDQSLPLGTHITQVYDVADGSLLILGEAGAGKTILLLELARDLLKRAELDENHPLPVVFNLSSWSIKRQSISDWLVNELNSIYQIPRALGQVWVDKYQILPLLDGLDEVTSEHRVACIEAINTYQLQYGIVSIVVCCRTDDYMTSTIRLRLNNAIVIQPLTIHQVDQYLESAGTQLNELRLVLSKSPMLQELIRTPLMLNVIIGYQEQPMSNLLATDSPVQLQQQILETYVSRMLQRRGSYTRYTSRQTLYWLKRLAEQLRKHDQTVFYIEQMQPDWLSNTRSKRLYQLIVRLSVGLIVGLVVGVVSTLVNGPIQGLLSGLAVSLGSGIDSKSGSAIRPVEVVAWSLKRWDLVVVLVGALLTGLTNILLDKEGVFLFNGVIETLLGTLIGSLISILISFLMLKVSGGWISKMLNEQMRIIPNQGIRNSIRNSIFVGVANGLFFGLVGGVGFGLSTGLFYGLVPGLLSGLGFGWFLGLVNGLFSGLRYGGTAFIQHITLRLLLWQDGVVPLNYPRFLDYAAERIFLRKVGGGYIFIHRLLLEYFASLD